MDEVDEVVVGCHHKISNRTGMEGRGVERIVTAEWEDTSNIRCKIGK